MSLLPTPIIPPSPPVYVRTRSVVFGDPWGSGIFIMSSGEWEKLPPGSLGVIEFEGVAGYGSSPFAVVRFDTPNGALRASLGPSAYDRL